MNEPFGQAAIDFFEVDSADCTFRSVVFDAPRSGNHVPLVDISLCPTNCAFKEFVSIGGLFGTCSITRCKAAGGECTHDLWSECPDESTAAGVLANGQYRPPLEVALFKSIWVGLQVFENFVRGTPDGVVDLDDRFEAKQGA